MIQPRPLALACAALFALPAQAVDYSNSFFFGDSLTDAGYYKPLLGAAGAVVGKFTTNPAPVWSENLATKLGTTAAPANTAGGTNYAQGGARITQSPAIGVPANFNTQALATQLGAHLAARGGRADANALYTVWGGANDIFYAAQAFAGNTTQITNYLLQTTAEQTALVETLVGAGARYVLVPNLPDIGNTPFGASQGAAGAAGLSSMSSNYNSLLYGQLAAKGLKVMPLDVYNLVREVQANPARYGLSNTTATACGATASLTCSPANYVQADAAQTYLFADGVHPTAAGNRLLADYAYGMLLAPSQIGLLAETPVRTQQALNQTLLSQAEAAADSEGGTHLWTQFSGSQLSFDQSAGLAGAEGYPFTLSIGIDTLGAHGGMGAALTVGAQNQDFSAGGDFSQRELALSFYGGLRAGAWSLNAVATLGMIDYDTARQMTLGPAVRQIEGATEGSSIAVAAQVAYQWGGGALSHGPFAELDVQRVSVAAFKESAASGASTALAYDEQTRDAVFAQLGYRFSYRSGGLSPYAKLAVEHELTEGERSVSASLPSASAGSFEVPAAVVVEPTAINATLGAGYLISRPLRAWVEANGSFGRDSLNHYGLNVGLRYAF